MIMRDQKSMNVRLSKKNHQQQEKTESRREAEDVYESESVVESSSKLPEEAVIFPDAASVKGKIH